MNPNINVEDAINFSIQYLKTGKRGEHNPYGYGLYLPNIMEEYINSNGGSFNEVQEFRNGASDSISTIFYEAAWELCRRGVLRPGIARMGGQATPEGASGNGYTLTSYGRQLLKEASEIDLVPLEPNRFAKMLVERGEKFGMAFVHRGNEATRTYQARAFLATCTMCGAASESILLSLAIEKAGEAKSVLNDYFASGGRRRIETRVIGQLSNPTQEEFRRYTDLLKYWRDSAPHGHVSTITEPEAFSALALLLRFAIFASDKWDHLTAK